MATTALAKKSPKEIWNGIEAAVTAIRRDKSDLDKNYIKLANLIYEVKTRRLWNDWKFTSFDEWRERQIIGIERTTVFKLLATKERLNGSVTPEQMESLGREKTYQLARLAKHKPGLVARALRKIEKPEVTLAEADTLVSRAISGQGIQGRALRKMDFLLPVEDVKDVERVLAVLQFIDALPGDVDPESDFGRGLLLVGLCRDYQSGEEYKAAEKKLEEAGDQGFTVEE